MVIKCLCYIHTALRVQFDDCLLRLPTPFLKHLPLDNYINYILGLKTTKSDEEAACYYLCMDLYSTTVTYLAKNR